MNVRDEYFPDIHRGRDFYAQEEETVYVYLDVNVGDVRKEDHVGGDQDTYGDDRED